MIFLLMLYAAFINLAAFCMYGIDKRRAIKGMWRISEKTLILIAVVGGSAGALLGMLVFRHKTRKPLFFIGIPLILILQFGIAAAAAAVLGFMIMLY